MTIVLTRLPNPDQANYRMYLAELKYWAMMLEQMTDVIERKLDPRPTLSAFASLIEAEAATRLEVTPCEPQTFEILGQTLTFDMKPQVDYWAAIEAYHTRRTISTWRPDAHQRAALIHQGWTPPAEAVSR